MQPLPRFSCYGPMHLPYRLRPAASATIPSTVTYSSTKIDILRGHRYDVQRPLIIQLPTSIGQNARHLLHLLLCQGEVSIINGIPYASYIGLVIPTPGLWSKQDVLELFTSSQLYHSWSDPIFVCGMGRSWTYTSIDVQQISFKIHLSSVVAYSFYSIDITFKTTLSDFFLPRFVPGVKLHRIPDKLVRSTM